MAETAPVRFIWCKPEVLGRLEQLTAHARVHAQRAGARARMFSLQLACLFVCAVSDLCCLLVITSPSEMTWSLQSSHMSLLQRAASVAFFATQRAAVFHYSARYSYPLHDQLSSTLQPFVAGWLERCEVAPPSKLGCLACLSPATLGV